jgi:hypothetical protein
LWFLVRRFGEGGTSVKSQHSTTLPLSSVGGSVGRLSEVDPNLGQ